MGEGKRGVWEWELARDFQGIRVLGLVEGLRPRAGPRGARSGRPRQGLRARMGGGLPKGVPHASNLSSHSIVR